MFFAAWKVVAQALFVTAGTPVWEWGKRAGSHCVRLALAVVIVSRERVRCATAMPWKISARALALLMLVPIALSAQPAMVIVVRHAEKASQTERDPVLSAEGAQRAKDLGAALAHAGIGSVITTQFQRTRLTAGDVLESAKLTPIVVPAGGATHPADVAAAVKARPAGEVVLVVGHSNTVGAIITALGGPRMGDICDSQYSNMYVLEMTGPRPKLIRANFGKADPVDPACASPMK
jgi:phosphohistidine phosphatase SixA